MSQLDTAKGIGIIGIGLLAAGIFYSVLHGETSKDTTVALPTPIAAPAPLTPPELDITPISVRIQSGDTLAKIFNEHQLSAATLGQVMASTLAQEKLTSIHPGQHIALTITPDHQLTTLVYPYNRDSQLIIQATRTGYKASIESKPVTIALRYKSGVVKQSLAQASHDAGLTLPMFHQLQDIFQGTIDFKHLKQGDHFQILYQEYFIDGRKDHPGNIIAANFTTGKTTHQAIRYTYPKNHTGYYDAHGQGIKPAFLRVPLKHYKRISSYFSYHRLDPYMHVVRPHFGVDYAAPSGTPILSIGDGKVVFIGKDHGYGNAVILRFNKKYKALYGHMSHFAKGLHRGDHVKRGQVIGYVGMTGWATGPHLHFGLYVYGIPRDPLKAKLPRGESVPASYTKAFHQYATKLLHRLDLFKQVELAQNGLTSINE